MYYLENYIDYLLKEKKYSLHTIRAYEKDIQNFWQFVGIETPLQEIDNAIIRKWIVWLSEKNISNKTINRKISSIKSYFKFLYIVKAINHYSLDFLKNLKIEKRIQIPFSKKEMTYVKEQQFLSENNFEEFRNQLIISLLYNLGIRKSELINLQLQDYMTDSFRIIGKGKKERRVPISKELQEQIYKYLILRNEQISASEEYFFLMKNGKKINQTFVYRLINNYFRAVTKKEKRSPHILRHTFATHLIENGAEVNAVKQLMGHSSLSSTQIYINNSVQELKKIYKQAHPLSKEKK